MTLKDWNQLYEKTISCRRCPRLVAWRQQIARQKRRMYFCWEYWGKPVPGFGDVNARLIIIGLAPGAHGSNRTGRMFTGDASGDFLYDALYLNGFANQPGSVNADDGLVLKDVFITAICRCAPPQNKPTSQEISNCQPFLLEELNLLKSYRGIVALGQIAFSHTIKIMEKKYELADKQKVRFGHGRLVVPDDGRIPWLLGSYHPSRQNTQTGRLTKPMFNYIWRKARKLLA